MLNLMFLPLMRNSVQKKEFAKKSIELAQTICDRNKRDACIASVVAFMSKYLNENEINDILGVLKMTDIVTRILVDDRLEQAKEIAKKAIDEGLSLNLISKLTGLDIETIKEIQKANENEDEI